MTLTSVTGSDAIISALLAFPENNASDAAVQYRFLVNGAQQGPTVFLRRTPDNFMDGQSLRVAAPNLASGLVTVKLQAQNLSNHNVYYSNHGVYVQFVDSTEATGTSFTSSQTSFTNSWKTVAQLSNFNVPANKMVQIGGSFRVLSGAAGTELQIRFVDSNELVLFEDSIQDTLGDTTTMITFFNKFAASGNRTIQLQARRVTGSSSITVRDRYLFAQTMERFHLWEAESTSIAAVPNDGNFHTVLETAPALIDEISRGPRAGESSYYSVVTGSSHATVPSQVSLPVHWKQQIYRQSSQNPSIFEPVDFDSGLVWGHTWSEGSKLVVDQAGGCARCGFNSKLQYKVRLEAKGACSNLGGNISIDRAILQMPFLPSTLQNDSGYSCTIGLTLEAGHPRNNC